MKSTMKMNVSFGICVDVIEFKEFMGKDIDKYKESFENGIWKKFL